MKRNNFTLLELLIGITLLMMAAGFVSWKVFGSVERRRFVSDLEKLECRLIACQRLALNMQADWKGILEKDKKGKWTLQCYSIDQPNAVLFPKMALSSFDLFFNGEEKEEFVFDFSSTGETDPIGALLFVHEKRGKILQKKSWELPELFSQERGEKGRLAPIHPSILSK